jgi:hypothetical protein
MALVLNQDIHRRERRFEDALYPFGAIGRHGNTSLNGFTVTFW